MKILIAYDGSECANAALADLQRAGLPQEADALVRSVADVFVPPPVTEADETFPFHVPMGIKRAHAHAARELDRAHFLAERAGERIRMLFPGWYVRHDATADSPAWAVVKKADEWRPELVVVGAHGDTSLGGRVILGSVSQRVLYEARASVRVARSARKATAEPVRIVVGLDGSPRMRHSQSKWSRRARGRRAARCGSSLCSIRCCV
jgi:nucleotide-binding universal stress UspA family protein